MKKTTKKPSSSAKSSRKTPVPVKKRNGLMAKKRVQHHLFHGNKTVGLVIVAVVFAVVGYFMLMSSSAASTTVPIAVRARGATGQEKIELRIKDKTVSSWNLTDEQKEYTYSHAATVGDRDIKVVFINDAIVKGVDRNVEVDYIKVNGKIFQTESSTVESLGSFTKDTECSLGYKEREWLHCAEAYFNYAIGSAGVLPSANAGVPVVVYARGTTGAEIIELKINDVTVDTWNLSTYFASYTYVHNATIGDKDIKIAFINDAWDVPEGNRDVEVDFIRVNDKVFPGEANTVFTTGFYSDATGCVDGFRNSQRLHCSGYMQFSIGTQGALSGTPSTPTPPAPTTPTTPSTPTVPTAPTGNQTTPVGQIPAVGSLPAYQKPPAPNGSDIVRVTNFDQLSAAMKNGTVRTIVMADGNYWPNPYHWFIEGASNKTLWAENKYGAYFDGQFVRDNVHIRKSENITFRGIKFTRGKYYGIRIGGDAGFSTGGSNKNITVDQCIFENQGQSGIAINNGYGSQAVSGNASLGGLSENITVQYSEFKQMGMDTPNYSFAEAIYTGNGGSTQYLDRVNGVNLIGNIFDGSGNKSHGEAMEIKTHTMNVLIERNYIVNWGQAEATDGGAIGLWIDRGLPESSRSIATAGSKGLRVINNMIIGTRNFSPYQKANGMMVGHAATIEGNTFRDNAHAGLGIRLGGGGWGFSNSTEADLYIKNNTFSNNGSGSIRLDDSGGQPFAARAHASGNKRPDTGTYPTSSGINWVTKGD